MWVADGGEDLGGEEKHWWLLVMSNRATSGGEDVLIVPPKKFMLASAIMNGRRKKLANFMAEGVVERSGSSSGESSCWDIFNGCVGRRQ